MTETLTQFKNCHLVRNHEIVSDDLWVRNGKIVDPEKVFFDERNTADQVIDCQNAIIAPGFIDIQINGKCRTCKVIHVFLKSTIIHSILVYNFSIQRQNNQSEVLLIIKQFG